MSTIMTASNQWAKRPADERFVSLLGMRDAMHDYRENSRALVVPSKRLEIRPDDMSDINTSLMVYGANGVGYEPTHFSFGQLCQRAGAPASYLRTLPAVMAADNLNWGIRHARDVEDLGVMLRRGVDGKAGEFMCATGPNYGRVWNEDVVSALVNKFGDGVNGEWRVPGEFGKRVDVTKENTTLYASDRDMFVFLADEDRRIEIRDRRDGKPGSFARGFFLWNSEVGASSIGAAFFLFDYVCCNRIVWGARDYKEIRLRHTVSAPDRWLSEIEPTLIEYANSETATVVDTIEAARKHKLEDAQSWLANRFTAQAAQRYANAFEADERRPMETLWDAVTGMTAAARNVAHQDARVAIEREAGKIMDMAARAA